jgi:hypothetical protein
MADGRGGVATKNGGRRYAFPPYACWMWRTSSKKCAWYTKIEIFRNSDREGWINIFDHVMERLLNNISSQEELA